MTEQRFECPDDLNLAKQAFVDYTNANAHPRASRGPLELATPQYHEIITTPWFNSLTGKFVKDD